MLIMFLNNCIFNTIYLRLGIKNGKVRQKDS